MHQGVHQSINQSISQKTARQVHWKRLANVHEIIGNNRTIGFWSLVECGQRLSSLRHIGRQVVPDRLRGTTTGKTKE